jgi:hypothetical protein
MGLQRGGAAGGLMTVGGAAAIGLGLSYIENGMNIERARAIIEIGRAAALLFFKYVVMLLTPS